MKPAIHPEYHDVQATCVCGNVIYTGSTKSAIKMDICSGCHPFFTGTQKIIDTEGRVEKFKKRYEAAATSKGKAKKQKSEDKGPAPSLAALAPVAEVPAEAPETTGESPEA